MAKKSIQIIFGLMLLGLTAVGFSGCGDCGDGEVEVCNEFQSFGKNGFVEDCVCVQSECSNDSDCEPGFFCDGGFCVAN